MKELSRNGVSLVWVIALLMIFTITTHAYSYADTDVRIDQYLDTLDDKNRATYEMNTEERKNYVEQMIRYALLYDETVINELNNGHKAVFMFDGASNSMKTSETTDISEARVSGLIVVLDLNDQGKPEIIYLSHRCSSIPDVPDRYGTWHIEKESVGPATVCDGTYTLYPTNHSGYSALNVRTANGDPNVPSVYLHPNRGYVLHTANGINVHTRSGPKISGTSKMWSAGCQLVNVNDTENRELDRFEHFMSAIYKDLPRQEIEDTIHSSKQQVVGSYTLNRYLLYDELVKLYDNKEAVDELVRKSQNDTKTWENPEEYLNFCNYGKCYYKSRNMVVTKDCRIWNIPCSDETDFRAVAVGNAEKGDVLKITGEVVNTADHLWYMVEYSGQECYIYEGHVKNKERSGWFSSFGG